MHKAFHQKFALLQKSSLCNVQYVKSPTFVQKFKMMKTLLKWSIWIFKEKQLKTITIEFQNFKKTENTF